MPTVKQSKAAATKEPRKSTLTVSIRIDVESLDRACEWLGSTREEVVEECVCAQANQIDPDSGDFDNQYADDVRAAILARRPKGGAK